jgi:hypothetical protein
MVDGQALSAADIELTDDGQHHEVELSIMPQQREESVHAAK